MPGTTFPANAYPSASSSYRPRISTPVPPVANLVPSLVPNPTRFMADLQPHYRVLYNDRSYQSPATSYHPPPMSMYSYHALQPQGQGVWDSNVPTMQYTPTFPPPPPAPPRQHKIWILDCKACGMFLSNRGMKAVLLLRPNVSLYSTDAIPANCSAFSPNSDAPLQTPVSTAEALLHFASSNASASLDRTCACLTQTLCCHGCGGMVGYMVVSPCNRCVTSTTSNNRATNGHRYVFHSSEVAGSERHYISLEPGVIPYDVNPNTAIPSRESGNGAHPHLHSAPQTFSSLVQQSPYTPNSYTPNSGSASGSDGNGYSSDMSLSRWRQEEWERQERDRPRPTLIPPYSPESLTTRGLRIMNQSQPQTSPRSQLLSWPLVHRSPPPLVLPELSPPQSDFEEDDEEDDDGPPPLIESSPISDNDSGPVYLFESTALALGSLGHEPYRRNVSFQPTHHPHPQNSSHYIQGPPFSHESRPLASSSSRAGSSSASNPRPGANPGHLNFPEVGFSRNRVVTLEPQSSDNAGEPAGDQTAASLVDKDIDTPDPNSISPRDSAAVASAACPQPALRKLRPGEVLYWHHLKRTGEMPAIVDDPRARSPCEISGMSGRVVREKVFAGR